MRLLSVRSYSPPRYTFCTVLSAAISRGRAFGQHAPAAHDRDAVGDVHDHVHVVLDHHNRFVALLR